MIVNNTPVALAVFNALNRRSPERTEAAHVPQVHCDMRLAFV